MRLLQPLRTPSVALLWGGLSLSAIGDQLYTVALTWVAVGVLGPAAGYLSALKAATVLITALGIGRWSDRWRTLPAMIGSDLIRALALLAAVAAWLATDHPSILLLGAAVVVLGAAEAVFRPSLQALLPVLTPSPRLLPAANALLDTTDRLARLLGPGLIGLAAALIPAVHFFTVDAASFLASMTALLAIARLRPGIEDIHRATTTEPFLPSVARGFRALGRHPTLRWVILTTGVNNGAWFTVYFLALPLIIDRLHVTGPGGAGLGAYGLVISAYGVTNLIGTLLIGGRDLPPRPHRLLFSGNIVNGTGSLLMAAGLALALPHAALLPLFCGAAMLAAFGGPMQDIPVAVLRQTELPRADIPAAMRAYLVMNNGGLLIAMLIAPLALATLPAWLVIGICALLVIGCGLVGLAFAGKTENKRVFFGKKEPKNF